MNTDAKLNDAIDRAKGEILSDVAKGKVPSTVESFGELHDYVDANEYGGLCDPDLYADEDTEFAQAVQEAVHGWITAGSIKTAAGRRVLVAKFDISGFSEAEAQRFAGALSAQAEGGESDWFYPSTEGKDEIDFDPPFPPSTEPRTILIHLNVSVPHDDARTANEITTLVEAALDVGMEGAPSDLALQGVVIDTTLAEEV